MIRTEASKMTVINRSAGVLLVAMLAGICAVSLAAPVSAAVPEAYIAAWNAAAPQIDANIERYRKGDAAILLVGQDGKPLPQATLEIRQQTHEFLFGCNLFVLRQLDTPELNAKYERAFARVFNFATVPFYWREMEPKEGQLRFDASSERIWRRPPSDTLVQWCKAHGITPKGHALMYVKSMFMPDWIDRNDAKKFKSLSEKHLTDIAQRYARDIPIWDVVNEEIPRLDNPKEWHAVWDGFLAWCFQEAGSRFPKETRLLINDGTGQAHITTAKYVAMIQELQARKVRVEGIGIQFHVGRGGMLGLKNYSPSQLVTAYETLGKLGLPLYITEITVPGVGKDGAAQQGVVVRDIYRLWFSTPQMAGVTWWNLADGTAYKDENKALGGLLDKDMTPKPAYEALDKLINHDWRTNLSARTDAQGKAAFRGFHGKYAVKVTLGGVTRQFEFNLFKDGPAQHTLTWKP